jgi:hypothetical protein
VAAFSLTGPRCCSGLDVVRYDADGLSHALGPAFGLKEEIHERHRTPSGAEQDFLYCRFEKTRIQR